MCYKPRARSNELQTLELLHKRMELNRKYLQHYFNLKKGFEGEVQFDNYTEKLQCECLVLNDLLLEVNHTTFQIDTLIMMQGMIYFYEVKNFHGDYYYKSDKLFKKPTLEVINPLNQLSRSESLLSQLLLSLGFSPQINAFVVFINPNFTLYQAPLDKPIIFPNQISQHIGNLDALSTKLTNKEKIVAEKLIALNITDSPYKRIPSYDFHDLRKGVTCLKCQTFSVSIEKRKCVCQKCGYTESITRTILRSIKEFRMLFPNQKITTNIIHDWCHVIPSKKTIRRILATNFKPVGIHQWTYYE